MKKLKVMTVVGTRPEIIRLSRVLSKLDQHFDHVLVHTGQNYDYELNEVFFEELKLSKPKHFLEAAGKNAIETIGKTLINLDPLLEKERPDALLVLGDTNSALSVIAAKKRKIPVFHMEAGNRCFDQRVPEEVNRKIVDHTADINLTYSERARNYLLREGLPPDRVIKTGSPMKEVLKYFKEDIEKSDILKKLSLKTEQFFVVSCHREENVDSEKRLKLFAGCMDEISKKYQLPIILSTHPRTKKRLEEFNIQLNSNVKIMPPLGFFDYNKLQISAKAVLSDSGTITEESSMLNFRALNIRASHERPEGMDEASVMLVGLEQNLILNALSLLETQKKGAERTLYEVDDYIKDNVSEKVARIIISYTHYTNEFIWHKKL